MKINNKYLAEAKLIPSPNPTFISPIPAPNLFYYYLSNLN